MPFLSLLARTTFLGMLLLAVAAPTPAADLGKVALADAEAAVGIDFKGLLASKAFKAHVEEHFRAFLKDPQVARVVELTLFNPATDLHRATLAFRGSKAAAVLTGNFNVERLEGLLLVASLAGDAAGKDDFKVKVLQEGGKNYFIVSVPVPPNPLLPLPARLEVAGTFADKSSLVLATDLEHLKQIVGGKPGEPTDGARLLRAGLAKLGGKETAYVGQGITERIKQGAGALPQYKDLVARLESVVGTVAVDEAIQVTVTIHAADRETAGELGAGLKDTLPVLKFLAEGSDDERTRRVVRLVVENLKLSTEGTAVVFRLKLDGEALKKLLAP